MSKILSLINPIKIAASQSPLNTQVAAVVLRGNVFVTEPSCNTFNSKKSCCNQGSIHAERNAVMRYFGEAGECTVKYGYRLKERSDKIE